MFKVLTLNNISVSGLERLPRESYEVASEIGSPDAILLRSFDMHAMSIPPTLKAVGRAGAGTNNIPVAKLSKHGIAVFNTPGANANAVKELVLAGMLIGCRNICAAWDFARNLSGDDDSLHKQVEAGKKQFAGTELPGRTLGVIGLGAIGRNVANMAIGLGMRVIGFDPDITVEGAWQLSSSVEKAHSVEALLAKSDFITFHVPLVEATRNMVDLNRVKIMKKGVVLLNFAREGIVNEQAISEAIQSGKIYAYICDFPSNKMKNHPRVVTLPHLGASTKEAEDNCAIMVAEQIRNFLEDGNIRNSVNFPEVQMERSEGFRISLVNDNVPNMVGQISTAIAQAGLNIIDMLNKSRGDLAYTLIDVNRTADLSLLDKLKKIDGVLAVRAI